MLGLKWKPSVVGLLEKKKKRLGKKKVEDEGFEPTSSKDDEPGKS